MTVRVGFVEKSTIQRGCWLMSKLLLRAFVVILGLIGPAMAQERILIASDRGNVTADLVDNNATRSLVQMLPLTIRNERPPPSGKDRQSAFTLAGGRAATRFLDWYTGNLELRSLCHLLS